MTDTSMGVTITATVTDEAGASRDYRAAFPTDAISERQFEEACRGIAALVLPDAPTDGQDRPAVDTSNMFGGEA